MIPSSGIRKEELKKHRIGALLQAVSSTVTPSISILATIVTFLAYTLSGRDMLLCKIGNLRMQHYGKSGVVYIFCNFNSYYYHY